MKLNAKQLRRESSKFKVKSSKLKKNEIFIILDNVLDTYNIGSIFRLADAVAAKKIYLCGGSATPPNHRIKKASINTTEWVEWEYCESPVEAIEKLKKFWNSHPELGSGSTRIPKRVRNDGRGIIIAVEQNDKSVPYDKFEYQLPIALVVGHESDGVSKEVLELCDGIVELPMFGVNISLNVMVSLGIVLYRILATKGVPSSNL